jgi:glycosyltransferase involved in cell wall biosynthesis
MKVAILTDVLGGGTGSHILSMVRNWDPARVEASIFTTTRYRDRIVPSVPVRFVPPPEHFRFYPAAQLQMLFRMVKIVEEFRPDVVHAYFFWSILYGRILKLSGRVKNLVENREDQGFNWDWHEYFWLRTTNRLPDRIICVSEAVKRVVVERERVEPSRVVVVHNGIEIHDGASADREATRRKLGFDADHLVIGMVANYNRFPRASRRCRRPGSFSWEEVKRGTRFGTRPGRSESSRTWSSPASRRRSGHTTRSWTCRCSHPYRKGCP